MLSTANPLPGGIDFLMLVLRSNNKTNSQENHADIFNITAVGMGQTKSALSPVGKQNDFQFQNVGEDWIVVSAFSDKFSVKFTHSRNFY